MTTFRRPAFSPCAIAVAALLFLSPSSWAWGDDGHQAIARLAAGRLSAAARKHIAELLGAPSERVEDVATAMAAAAIWPDHGINRRQSGTGGWHFIDIGANDTPNDVPQRCPQNNCVTAQVTKMRLALQQNKPDRFGLANDLRFLIHFVGDLHQPLHTITNADKGGNCRLVPTLGEHANLHSVWDTTIVRRFAHGPIADQPAFVQELTALLVADAGRLSAKRLRDVTAGTPEQWAWQAHEMALEKVYAPELALGREPFLEVEDCQTQAPPEVRGTPLVLSEHYLRSAQQAVRVQLTRAGLRLASVLNGIWPPNGQ